MDKIKLNVKTRKEIGKKLAMVREQGYIPAVLYGHGIKNINLSVPYNVFEKTYGKAGESTLVNLSIDEKEPVIVLIQEVQIDPVKDRFMHVDFYQVKMTEKIEAEIKLLFINEAPIVKDEGGILVTSLDTLNVKCFPQDLISEIEVDLSGLKTFNDKIHVSDLKVPEKIEILDSPGEVVVSVTEPRSEEELAELDKAPVETVEAEVVGKEKEGEAAEGESEAGGEGSTPAPAPASAPAEKPEQAKK